VEKKGKSPNSGEFGYMCISDNSPSVSETIHEVPHVFGNTPCIVLAVFFAMSEDDEEIFVWS